MPSMFDVKPELLINKAAEQLKEVEQITPPSWAPFVKTGMHKERPPADNDWWYARSASLLRKIRIKGPIGTAKLRRMYGGKKNNGVAPGHFYKGSGSIIRKSLQQLEKAGLAKQVDVKGHKGRVITPKGISLLDKAAQAVLASQEKKPIIPKVNFVEKKQRQDHTKIVEQLVKARLEKKKSQAQEAPDKKGKSKGKRK